MLCFVGLLISFYTVLSVTEAVNRLNWSNIRRRRRLTTAISHWGVSNSTPSLLNSKYDLADLFSFLTLWARNVIDISASEIMCCLYRSCSFRVVGREACWHEWSCLNAGREKVSINTVDEALFICQEMDCSHWEEKLLIWLWCGN